MNAFAEEPEDLGYVPGHVNRTKNGRPYALANPDWDTIECKARGFTKKSVEPRGLSRQYTRTTKYIEALEETYNLGRWQNRMVALGMSMRPQLVLQAQRIDLTNEDATRDGLDEIATLALDAANWKLKADQGTDFHEITYEYDGGRRNWSGLNDVSKKMLAAYIVATKGFEYAYSEVRMINDELGYLGKTDKLRHRTKQEDEDEADRCGWSPEMGTPKHRLRVCDLKTGRIDFGQSKMALQLAAYALGQMYDPDTGIRTELDIDLEYAEIIHAPYGEGTCKVYPVPLAPAVEALTDLIPRVRAFRAKTDWFDAPRVSDGSALSGVDAAWKN